MVVYVILHYCTGQRNPTSAQNILKNILRSNCVAGIKILTKPLENLTRTNSSCWGILSTGLSDWDLGEACKPVSHSIFVFWLIPDHFSGPAEAAEHDPGRPQSKKRLWNFDPIVAVFFFFFPEISLGAVCTIRIRRPVGQTFLRVHPLKVENRVTNGGFVPRKVRSSWWTLAESARGQ